MITENSVTFGKIKDSKIDFPASFDFSFSQENSDNCNSVESSKESSGKVMRARISENCLEFGSAEKSGRIKFTINSKRQYPRIDEFPEFSICKAKAEAEGDSGWREQFSFSNRKDEDVQDDMERPRFLDTFNFGQKKRVNKPRCDTQGILNMWERED